MCTQLLCRLPRRQNSRRRFAFAVPFELKNEPLLKLWLKNLSRANFQPTEYSRVCSRHFSEDDFVVESKGSNPSQARQQFGSALLRRRLKLDAVPHFSDLPSHSGASPAVPRSELACLSSREAAVRSVVLRRRLRNVKQPNRTATYTI
ncbi:MAG: THAP domain-containing protein, partial [Mesoflavibacter sp.]|nr:THAP domain-containing protein [Mesoflavibacter sp.]